MCNLIISGAWKYKNVIVPLAVGTPLALEGGTLTKNTYQAPQVIKENFAYCKDRITKAYTLSEGEDIKEGVLRISKNCIYLLSCLSLMSVACYFSATLLPAQYSITVAISSVFLIGKLFWNAEEYKDELIQAFTKSNDESTSEAKTKIQKNILKAVLYTTATVATIAIGAHILMQFSHHFTWKVSLPWQTKGVVFAEYASLGLLHGGIAYNKWKKGDRIAAIFHVFCGALSFIFPSYYWNNDMRLHHSFYGLALMALPSRPLQFLGGMITLTHFSIS